MALGDDLVKKLARKFEPSTTQTLRYRNYDLAVVIDKNGDAVQLFMGKKGADGNIKGDRYARVLKHDSEGQVLKDHWERKGKAS